MPIEIVKLIDANVEDVSTPNFDIQKGISKYELKPAAFIYMSDVKYNGKPFALSITGEFKSDGVIVNAEYATHSVKIDLNDEQAVKLKAISKKLFTDDKFEFKETIDDENSMYLKLKYKRDKSKYSFTCNKPIFPKNPSAADFESGETVTATGKLAVYYNLQNNTSGLSFILKDLNV